FQTGMRCGRRAPSVFEKQIVVINFDYSFFQSRTFPSLYVGTPAWKPFKIGSFYLYICNDRHLDISVPSWQPLNLLCPFPFEQFAKFIQGHWLFASFF